MTTNRESGPPAVGVPEYLSDETAGRPPPAADVHRDPADDDTGDIQLPLENATAYGIEGYDPDDPWNAVLCVESERAVTVLPLTPRSLGELVTSLAEVQEAQRFALGASGLAGDDGGDGFNGGDGGRRDSRGGAFRGVTDAARFATGSAPVARLWQTSMRGRLTIIAGAVLFVVIGIVASVFAR